MTIVVDMNLSPAWVSFLNKAGFAAIHWSAIGPGTAADADIMQWCRDHDAFVLTHDLDFGTLLALTHACGPSVVQVRAHDVTPGGIGGLIVGVLKRFESELAAGSLIVVDEAATRIRVLPLAKAK